MPILTQTTFFYLRDVSIVCEIGVESGYSLPFPTDSWIDLISAQGMFIELQLTLFNINAKEFFHVLKPGGRCVFDYIDISTPGAWAHFQTYSIHPGCFTYYGSETVDRVFCAVGFVIERYYQIGKSTYLIARKPKTNGAKSV